MKVPIKIYKEKLVEEDIGYEVTDISMLLESDADFDVSEIKIVPTWAQSNRITNLEIYTVKMAKKLMEEYPDMFNSKSHFSLGRVIRDAFIDSLAEATEDGRDIFQAFVDRPKYSKQQKKKTVIKEDDEEQEDPMQKIIEKELEEIETSKSSPKKKAKKVEQTQKKEKSRKKVEVVDELDYDDLDDTIEDAPEAYQENGVTVYKLDPHKIPKRKNIGMQTSNLKPTGKRSVYEKQGSDVLPRDVQGFKGFKQR